MHGPFRAVKITDHVYWVGAIDWGIRNFHGYATSRGTTYNAYLILADKLTLIDTVKAPFKDEMLARIASVIKPADINYIISTTARVGGDSNISRTAVFPEEIGDLSPFEGNIALLFGCEPAGLSNEEIGFSDLIVTIPCSPGYSSMNLSSAAAIMLYFISRKLKLAQGIQFPM